MQPGFNHPPQPLTIVLIDDHPILRESLAERLDSEPWLRVIGQAASADDGVRLLCETKPDLAAIDIDLRGELGLDVAAEARLHTPHTQMLFISGYATDGIIQGALDIGINAFVSKTDGIEEVLRALKAIAAGKPYYSPAAAERLMPCAVASESDRHIPLDGRTPRPAPPRSTRSTRLTDRERQMLLALAEGAGRKQIAYRTGLSVKTIRRHCDKLMAKLAIHDRVELTRFAIREGLIEA